MATLQLALPWTLNAATVTVVAFAYEGPAQGKTAAQGRHILLSPRREVVRKTKLGTSGWNL